jgi:GNAT superfamily N-acetyltransferase
LRKELKHWTAGGGSVRSDPVTQLWARADHRKRGYGPALMEAVEREALVRGCIQIVLNYSPLPGAARDLHALGNLTDLIGESATFEMADG